ncbi:hypothetical protein Ciccas_008238 [Cichlidogyrus casuarinus]|uniref:EF-hand domain-containing protein n=1 Tax=Cichlidogyrus casuarinus TaxID=1844966 RepID=A0ABD2Q0I5_9PLAT
MPTKKAAEGLIAIADKNKDGKIAASELMAYFKSRNMNISLNQCERLVQSMDTNKDNKLDLNELIELLKKLL